MKAKEVLLKYDICRQTLSRWVKNNTISFSILPSGRYDYGNLNTDQPEFTPRKTVIYSRVSTSGQKDNLKRQIERLKSFASSNGFVVNEVYSDVASALNYNRKGYTKLITDICTNKVDNLIIEYKDRLLRIGYTQIEQLCKIFNTNIIVIDQTDDSDINKELTTDLISIIHHFSSKMYTLRRNKNKINQLISQETIDIQDDLC